MGYAQKGFFKRSETFWIALLISILLHLVIVIPSMYAILDHDDEHGTLLQVDFFGLDEIVPLAEKTPEEQLDEYDPKDSMPDGQVVRAPKTKDSRRPEKSDYLSEHDSRVEKETRSRIQRPGDSYHTSPTLSPSKGQDAKNEEGGMRSIDPAVTPLASVPEIEEGGQIRAADPKRSIAPSLENLNLELSQTAIASAVRGSGLDHLEDVIPGDMTALNTKRWTHASFFNRVKNQVEQFWHPDVEYEKHDPYGNVYGFKDRTTVILVVLSGDGSLKHAYVMSPSGAAFLDKEAKEAIEQAAPFPNVPDGLKDQNDNLVKFTFHFIVDVGGQPVFRMRRYK